jgi:hypothetical protein
MDVAQVLDESHEPDEAQDRHHDEVRRERHDGEVGREEGDLLDLVMGLRVREDPTRGGPTGVHRTVGRLSVCIGDVGRQREVSEVGSQVIKIVGHNQRLPNVA